MPIFTKAQYEKSRKTVKQKYGEHYCPCAGYWKGKHHLEETKEKLRRYFSGRKNPKHSETMKKLHKEGRYNYKNMRKKGVGFKKGYTPINFKTGINGKYYRRIAGISKNSKCSLCESDKNLLVHHKDKNRNNNKLTNLIIVCRKCHVLFHPLIGKNQYS